MIFVRTARVWIFRGLHFGNPFEPIILASLKNIPLDDIVKNCCLSLSEAYFHRILLAHGIKNESGVYNLDKFTAPSDLDINKYHLKSKMATKKELETVLAKWISKTEESFSDNKCEWAKQNLLVSVFYRYIQWSHALKQDNRSKLAGFLTSFLNAKKVPKETKQKIQKMLLAEQKKFEDSHFSVAGPMETLFNNSELTKLINPVKK